MKKNILITAGGTATAWHISKTIRDKLSEYFKVFICDINEKEYVASSINADFFLQVPRIDSENYYEYMLNIVKLHDINIVVPLIDADLHYFNSDNIDLKKLRVISTAPSKKLLSAFSDKHYISTFCDQIGIDVPKEISYKDVNSNDVYFIKPLNGFGSRGAKKVFGKEILENKNLYKDFIIQELCEEPEVTVEIFYKSKQKYSYIIRERVETKAGVSTKAKFIQDTEIDSILKVIFEKIDLPRTSCIQFMKKNTKWMLTDFNLRLGAGTALSSAIGWDLVYAFLIDLIDVDDPFLYLNKPDTIKKVVRVYQEIVME